MGFVDEVVAALEERGDPRFEGVDDVVLERRLRVAAVEVAASTCRWLELLAEAVRRGLWARQGAKSPSQWLSWAVSMAESTAREQVRVALRLRKFPQVADRFRQGRLSYSKVRAITRLDRPELEGLLLEYAEVATGAQLERIVRDLRSAQQTGEAHRADPFDLRNLQVHDTDHGTVRIVVEVPREEGLAAVAGLREEAVRLRREATGGSDGDGGSAESAGSLSAFMADAWLAAVHALAADGPGDVSGADRHTLVIHADADALADRDGDRQVPVRLDAAGRSRTASMSVRVLRRLACDTRLAMIAHHHDGAQAGVSGTTRRVPSRLRRLLVARDRSCRFPGCCTTVGLDAHHIVHVADGGATTLDNLVLLCRFHHSFVHDRGWSILTDGSGRFRFAPPRQPPLPTVAPLPADSAESPSRQADTPDPAALQPHWDGTPPDYHTCVTVLQDELARLQPPRAA